VIPIHIDPNIAMIGPFLLSWHGLFSAIGVLFGVTIGVRMAAARGVDEDATYSLALWAVVGGIVGARLFHVVDAWSYYSQNPLQIVMITEGGIAIYGAVIGGVLTGTLYAVIKRMPVGHLADAGAVGLILGQAIGRIGDVINGEHHGLPSTAPWSVTYLHPNTLGELGVSVHLTIGYELVWNLMIFALLVAAFDRVRQPGLLFWGYFLLYAIGRFVTGFYRVDADVAFGLGQAQIVAVVTALLAVAMLIWLSRRAMPPRVSGRRPKRTVTRSR
jgi:phosphatidylglycerol---prolipoprotein diacylglyceryl transferase